MMWHRRETRRPTEKTKIDLQHWEEPGYSTLQTREDAESDNIVYATLYVKYHRLNILAHIVFYGIFS